MAAAAIGGTVAYFSDTETSEGNLFSAGTIDISVKGDDFTWSRGAVMEDMKPCYTDYINFVIYNDGEGANPVNVWKRLYNFEQDTGVLSESECTSQGGVWSGTDCDWGGKSDKNNIISIIDYDLSVKVYKNDGEIWSQMLYEEGDVTVKEIKNSEMFLGMIPAGGYMEVTQSYHMQDPDKPTNWAQGDNAAFDIEVKAVQLRGTAWLENKDTSKWKVLGDDDIKGTLEYEVKSPKFVFEFDGKVELPSTTYVLAAGYDGGSDVDTYLGEADSDADGNISFSGEVDLNKDLKDVKVWLLPKTSWNGGSVKWLQMDKWLWETGLIWYEDTDK